MHRKKSLGQCFLEDRNILRLEARLADVKGKRVLEIGAGDGRLTKALIENNPKKIYAVEKDPRFASMLKMDNVEVIEGDFLEIELPDVDVVIGNIPYYISSDIIFSLKRIKFEKAVLMVQKEFAQKMVAKPGEKNYGRLSVTSQIHFQVSLERTVPARLFRPVPKVDSAIITLRPTGASLDEFEENIIRYLFQHKNKTVRNALLDSKKFEKPELGEFSQRRVKTLTKEECLEIARILKNVK
jgi:16S rRNA (adenine1518-N6/adenine1519-N6)-dimethyltransferase